MVDAEFSTDIFARMARSLHYWQVRGWAHVSLPWLAPERYTACTRPLDAPDDPTTTHGNLLASGEQSFLMLEDQGRLPDGDRFIGWTPCFRHEPVFDSTHHFYFLKAELYQRTTEELMTAHLNEMVEHARVWMDLEAALTGQSGRAAIVQTGFLQFDIEVAGMEVGSYGVRAANGRLYVYGTACAEPRLSTALALQRVQFSEES